MKSLLVVGVLSLSMIAGTAQAAGVPVIDAGSIAQAITQVQNQVNQIQKARDQLRSLTGNSMLGQILNDPNTRKLLNQHLPKGYSDVYQAMERGDLGALQTVYEGVVADEKRKRTQGTGKERLASTMLLNKAQTTAMMGSLNQRSNNIQSLLNQINLTTDASSKADLANRLTAEQNMISLDMNKMQVAMKISEQNEALARRQVMSQSRGKMFK
jgi:type IV secretion system protein VirB5